MTPLGAGPDPVRQAAEAGTELLAHVQRFNWILLALIIGGSWSAFSWPLAKSVLIGGLLANASFFLLRRGDGDAVAHAEVFFTGGGSFP